MKKILITGAYSYIGISVENWLNKTPEEYIITTLDMLNQEWNKHDFSAYDVVFHVAGIAHADVGNVSDETKKLYYKVNTDLAIEVAKKAKCSGVKQFIFMSSMIVYSGCGETRITKNTTPKALNFYGDSKLKADVALQEMNSDTFKVVVLRPPMIYGKGSKGNYPQLAKMASKLPVFPKVNNKRSMLHIDNLCEFIKQVIDKEEKGIFFPQNAEYTNTSEMVKMIADAKKHKLILLPGTGWMISIMKRIPGKIGDMATKAFGDLYYDMDMSITEFYYRVNTLNESVKLTER